MGHWGFVLLAYGLVWLAIVLYAVILRWRLQKVEAELSLLAEPRESPGATRDSLTTGARGAS